MIWIILDFNWLFVKSIIYLQKNGEDFTADLKQQVFKRFEGEMGYYRASVVYAIRHIFSHH